MLELAGIVSDSIVDGPGIRTTVFAQGCPHHCQGCHNPETWDFGCGTSMEEETVLQMIEGNPLCKGVTFSGGEPFAQAEALVPIAETVKARQMHLMIYTGYLLEELQKSSRTGVQRLLELADILVDGPFVLEERNLTLPYRGSENQRVIDLPKTRESGKVVLYRSEYDDLDNLF